MYIIIYTELSCSLSTICSDTSLTAQKTPAKRNPVMQSTPIQQAKPDSETSVPPKQSRLAMKTSDTPIHSSSSHSSSKRRRKFPGPAGTLPKLVI